MKPYTSPSRLREFLSRILFPSAWYMAYEYDPEWDHFIRMSMFLGMIAEPKTFTTFAGRKFVWLANYPYAFGCSNYPYAFGCSETRHYGGPYRRGRPSYATIKALKTYLDQRYPEWDD